MTNRHAMRSAAGHRKLTVNGRSLDYELVRSHRKTLGITVEPDRRVVVSAPAAASEDRIEAILKRLGE